MVHDAGGSDDDAVALMQIDAETVVKAINMFGLPLVLVLAQAYLIIRGQLVPGWAYREMCDRAARMEALALRNTDLAQRAVESGQRMADRGAAIP